MNKTPFEVYRPQKLFKYINNFSFYKHDSRSNSPLTMMPLGTVHIIFQLGTSIFHKTPFSNGWKKRPDVFIGGPFNAFYQMKDEQGAAIFAIEFKHGKSRHFMSANAYELKNQLINPADIWGTTGRLLYTRVRNAKNNKERVLIMEQFLLDQFQNISTSYLEKSVNNILMNNGLVCLKELSSMAGISISHFRKKFKEEIGLNPKEFQKMVRINALIKYYNAHPSISLTELGYKFEYFDQSHFIKDFRSATGLAPKSFFSA